jgi:3-dehydrosphinganine reductase
MERIKSKESRQMDIAGKCAIVTGGSSGIGKAIAKRFATRGANVFLIARRKDLLEAALEEVEKEARDKAQLFGLFSADVSDKAAVEEAVRAAEERCGPAAVLVNSAGVSNPGYVEKLTISSMETEISVNYLGAVYMIKSVIEGMMERRDGHILSVSSLAGLKGIFGYTGYCGSKFALIGFSEALRSEMRPYGIVVSALCPPDVDTPMLAEENKVKPLETLKISEGAKIMSPGDVADAAMAGMEKGSFIIIPDSSGRMFHGMNRLAPSLIDAMLNKIVDKARKEKGL